MYAPRLIRSKLPCMSAAVRRVDERDVTFRLGTPVTRAKRAVLDLALDGDDPSLVADVLADAERRLPRADFDHARLAELFAGSVGRWGVPEGTLEALAAEAGLDVTTLGVLGGQA
jgi:hypothetical protein